MKFVVNRNDDGDCHRSERSMPRPQCTSGAFVSPGGNAFSPIGCFSTSRYCTQLIVTGWVRRVFREESPTMIVYVPGATFQVSLVTSQ